MRKHLLNFSAVISALLAPLIVFCWIGSHVDGEIAQWGVTSKWLISGVTSPGRVKLCLSRFDAGDGRVGFGHAQYDLGHFFYSYPLSSGRICGFDATRLALDDSSSWGASG